MIIFRRFRLLGCFNYMCKTFKAFYEMVACIIVTEIQTSFLFILRGLACFKIWIVMWKIQEMVPKSWEKWNCYANYTNHCNFIFISNVCRLLFDFFFVFRRRKRFEEPRDIHSARFVYCYDPGPPLICLFQRAFCPVSLFILACPVCWLVFLST